MQTGYAALCYAVCPHVVTIHQHCDVRAGSVDEQAHEQGIAHFVEHITFLGSKKRESLLGTGARSNAYTDFHHTVFHVHAPLINGTTGMPMLPQVGLWHSLVFRLLVEDMQHVLLIAVYVPAFHTTCCCACTHGVSFRLPALHI